MAWPVNSARGEVALRIGAVDIVIAAEIERLAAVSTALGCQSFREMYLRVVDVELAAALAAVRHLTVRGDASAAASQLTLADLAACQKAFTDALSHHVGKAATVEEGATAAATTTPSHGIPG